MARASLHRLGRMPRWPLSIVFLSAWMGVVILGLLLGRPALGLGYALAIVLLLTALGVAIKAALRKRSASG